MYIISQKLREKWERQTGLTWDQRRAETFLQLLNIPPQTDPEKYIRALEVVAGVSTKLMKYCRENHLDLMYLDAVQKSLSNIEQYELGVEDRGDRQL